MAHIFGISNHSPDKTLDFLRARKVVADLSEIAIVPSGTLLRPDARPVRKILFIVSISDLYRNLTVINSKQYRDASIFVFASPLRINELYGAHPLDFVEDPCNRGVGFIMQQTLNWGAYTKALKSADGATRKVKRLDNKYLTVLIEAAKHGSLLNPLMTLIYTMPGATQQSTVKEAVADYLFKGTKLAKLEAVFDSMPDAPISQKHRDGLRTILVSEIGENYRTAFEAYRKQKSDSGKTPSLAAICKKHGTSEYEMSYIRSIVENRTKNKSLIGTTLNPAQQQQATEGR